MASMGSPNCLDDGGYLDGEEIRTDAVKQGARLRQIAALAIAIDNAKRLMDNYRAQRDIAKRILTISQKQQDRVREVFWPREEQFLNEFANPDPVEDVEVMGRRYGGRLVSSVSAAFAVQLKELKCSASRYCLSAYQKAMADLMMARSVAIGNARVLGRNIAFAEKQAREDQNLQRRMQAVALGRGLMQQAVALYAAAGQGLAAAGRTLEGQLSSAFSAFGYASRDYSNSVGYNSTLMQGQREYASGQYRNGQSYAPQYAIQNPSPTSFGFQTSMNAFSSSSAADVMSSQSGWNMQNTLANPYNWGQNERQMNEADVGNRDLARTGSRVYTTSDGGTFTFSMSDFKLAHVDEYNPGDTGPAGP